MVVRGDSWQYKYTALEEAVFKNYHHNNFPSSHFTNYPDPKNMKFSGCFITLAMAATFVLAQV